MTAEIIQMPERHKGNGAREALMAALDALPLAGLYDGADSCADAILASLAMTGFVIVPVTGEFDD